MARLRLSKPMHRMMERLLFTALFGALLVGYGGAQTVTSESAIVMDGSSGKILWARNADEQLYPASTTKIMTALLLIERCKPDEIIVAPQDVQTVRESTMHLFPGERVRAKDMLYALLLRSANDGCYAVANHISGSVEKFADLMNQRAKELGCTHTHFDNPNGLNDKLHYTTAHDLAVMAQAAMTHPEFRDIVKTERIKISRGTNWKDVWMVNHNKILKRDPTCDGIKTGWTIPAGHCFVGSATRNGWQVITVVMKSKSWENDTEALFHWAFDSFEKRDEVKAGQVCASVNVKNGSAAKVGLVAEGDAYSLQKKNLPEVPLKRTLSVPNEIQAPVNPAKVVGALVLTDPDGFTRTVPLRPVQPVSAKIQPIAAAVSAAPSSGRFVIAAGLLVSAIYVKGRHRKRFSRLFS